MLEVESVMMMTATILPTVDRPSIRCVPEVTRIVSQYYNDKHKLFYAGQVYSFNMYSV